MKLWKNNKLSGEYEMPEQEIANRFLASKYADYPWRLDRALGAFIGDNEPDGLASVWDLGDPAYDRVFGLILDTWRSARQNS